MTKTTCTDCNKNKDIRLFRLNRKSGKVDMFCKECRKLLIDKEESARKAKKSKES